jgi:hypothetical protein
MTVVSFLSVKGAPGVTTLCCLVGGTWPAHRRVMVVECDPSGGDLATRFGLSARCGWPTLATSARREGGGTTIAPHLQQLPGGLDVLVGTRPSDLPPAKSAEVSLLARTWSAPDDPWDALVDLGRLRQADDDSQAWLHRSDSVVVVTGSEAASVVQVRERAPALRSRYEDRLGLVVIGSGPHQSVEIEAFTGIRLFGELPSDPVAAGIACGAAGGGRRLMRSLLVASVSRLSRHLASDAGGNSDSLRDSGPDQRKRPFARADQDCPSEGIAGEGPEDSVAPLDPGVSPEPGPRARLQDVPT